MKKALLMLMFSVLSIFADPTVVEKSKDDLDQCALLYNAKKFEDALKLCDQAIKLDSNNANAFEIRGWVKVNLFEYQEAIKDFEKAQILNPNSYQILFKKGYTYFFMKEYQKAIEKFDQAIKLNPDFINSYFFRGRSFNKLEKLDSAIQDFKICLNKDPEWTEVVVEVAVIYLKKKDFNKAHDLFSFVIQRDKNNAFALYNRGVIRLTIFKEENKENGCQDLKFAVMLDYKGAKNAYESLCNK